MKQYVNRSVDHPYLFQANSKWNDDVPIEKARVFANISGAKTSGGTGPRADYEPVPLLEAIPMHMLAVEIKRRETKLTSTKE